MNPEDHCASFQQNPSLHRYLLLQIVLAFKVRRYIDIPGIPGISLISIPAVLKSAQNEYTENTWYTGKVPDKSYTYQKKVRNQLVHAKRLPFLLLIHCLRCLYPAQIPNLLLYTNKS